MADSKPFGKVPRRDDIMSDAHFPSNDSGSTSAPPSPTLSCRPGSPSPPAPQVYLAHSLDTLLLDCPPGSIVAVDIDETLIMTKHMPSLLLSNEGIRAFQKYVFQLPVDFATKNRLCRSLQTSLQRKVLTEKSTAEVIRGLQAQGCHVFGLTARYMELAHNTKTTLLSLGIDLAATAPLPTGRPLTEPQTQAVCQDGIIFCNNVDKGTVLERFMQHIIMPEVMRRRKMAAAYEAKSPMRGVRSHNQPIRFFFVDDRYDMCESVWTAVTSGTAMRCDMEVECYHYCPPHLGMDSRLEDNLPLMHKVLEVQIEAFAKTETVLSNEEALHILDANPRPSSSDMSD